jgi:DNA-binding beta-propeller fold protein YncE
VPDFTVIALGTVMGTQRRLGTEQGGPGIARVGVRAWRRFAMAVAAVGVLVVPASASASFTSLTPFSGPPGGDEGWCPSALALYSGPSGALQVYVADPCNGQLDAFSPDGQTLTQSESDICTNGETDEFLEGPNGIAVDQSNGDVYVAGSGNAELFEFDGEGNYLGEVGGGTTSTSCNGTSGEASSGDDYFSSPQGLAFDGGDVFAADFRNGTVDEYSSDFSSLVKTIDVEGTDGLPEGVAIDAVTGHIFVTDDGSETVLEYGSDGTLIRTFATGFDSTPFAGLGGIAIDPVAHVVYVADSTDDGTANVDTFDEATGASLQQITGLDNPEAVAIDPVNHRLYVAEGGYSEGPLQPVHGPDISNPPLDEPGVDVFSYTPAPTCTAQPSDTAVSGVAKSFTLSCTDADGQPVTYAIAAGPGHGTLTDLNTATGTVTYTPTAGYAGGDSFTFRANSQNGTSAPATVTITDSPNCAPETATIGYEQSQVLTVVCSPASSYQIITPAAHGSLTTPTSAGAITYSPDSLFTGTDSFTYVGVSNGVTSAPTTVTLDVGTSLPPPVEGQTANVYFSSGTVLIYLPGQTTPIPLLAGMQVPLGSVIDATNGRVGIFVAIDGAIQTADFFDGKFKLTQEPAPATVLQRAAQANLIQVPGPQTILQLLGAKVPKVKCAVHPKSFSGTFTIRSTYTKFESLAAQIASKKAHGKGKPIRQLWGSGHGDFTTVGGGSSASVRGTQWAIFDYPDGTLTFDFTDSVTVDDFHLHKTVIITAGHYYFAALGGLPRCK